MTRAIAGIVVVAVAGTGTRAMGMASVDHIVSKGQEYSQQLADQWAWPAGTMDLVNDPLRTDGWLPWFSELPNDVNRFQLDLKNTDDANRLIAKLAKVKADRVIVVLSSDDGPVWLRNWRMRSAEDTAAEFHLGSQKRLDDWFKHLPNGKFGAHTYTEAPKAQPPTLTIYVARGVVDLSKLEIPQNVKVEKTIGTDADEKARKAIEAFVGARARKDE